MLVNGSDIDGPHYYAMNCRRCVWGGGFLDKRKRFVPCCDYDAENTPVESLDACPAGGPVTEEEYRARKECGEE